jgi:hypothetical protein
VRVLLTRFEIDAQLKSIFYSYPGKIFKWERILKRRHIRVYIMLELVLWFIVTDALSYVTATKMNSFSKGKGKVVLALN